MGIGLRMCTAEDLLADPALLAPSLVIADPPWTYRSNSDDAARGAARQYDTLKISDIRNTLHDAFQLATDDAYLVLWITFPILAEWMRVDTAWRFLTGGAWVKTGPLGMGYHQRGNAEAYLLYGKGKPVPHSRSFRSGLAQPRLEHSCKPVIWQAQMIKAWCPPGGLVLDLYAGLGSVAHATIIAGEGRSYLGAEPDPDRHRQASALIHRIQSTYQEL